MVFFLVNKSVDFFFVYVFDGWRGLDIEVVCVCVFCMYFYICVKVVYK